MIFLLPYQCFIPTVDYQSGHSLKTYFRPFTKILDVYYMDNDKTNIIKDILEFDPCTCVYFNRINIWNSKHASVWMLFLICCSI